MSEFLLFRFVSTTGKTVVEEVISKVNNYILGRIKWYAPWRRYCFIPENSLFDSRCLTEIAKHIDEMMEERKTK